MQRLDVTTYPVVTIQPYFEGADGFKPNVSLKDLYYLKEEVTVKWSSSMRTYKITLPKGYVFDGASIPKSFWTVLGIHPASPRIVSGAAFHDYVFTPLIMTRKEADQLLVDILKAHKMPPLKRFLVRTGLFLGGWVVYYFTGKYSQRNIKKLGHAEIQQLLENVEFGEYA